MGVALLPIVLLSAGVLPEVCIYCKRVTTSPFIATTFLKTNFYFTVHFMASRVWYTWHPYKSPHRYWILKGCQDYCNLFLKKMDNFLEGPLILDMYVCNSNPVLLFVNRVLWGVKITLCDKVFTDLLLNYWMILQISQTQITRSVVGGHGKLHRMMPGRLDEMLLNILFFALNFDLSSHFHWVACKKLGFPNYVHPFPWIELLIIFVQGLYKIELCLYAFSWLMI